MAKSYSAQSIQFTRLLDKMLRDKRLHNAKLPVAMKMLFLSRRTGCCIAGHMTIAKMVNLSPRHVVRVKAELVEMGYFKKAKNGNGRGKTDWYEPVYDPVDPKDTPRGPQPYYRPGTIDNDTWEEVPEPAYDDDDGLFN